MGNEEQLEYHYGDAPEPPQSMAQLRQERLQQLHGERMRRQQRRMSPDITTALPWKRRGGKKLSSLSASMPPQLSPSQGPNAFLSRHANEQFPEQMSPVLSLPSNEVSPMSASTLPPPNVAVPIERGADNTLLSAAASVQDTGMIERVKIRRASYILQSAFIVARVLGLFRTTLFAFVFGAGLFSDSYYQAFIIPELIYNVVAGGALSSAFIPVFTTYMTERKEKTAWHVTSSALNLAIAIMMGFALIAILFARQLVPLYNPGVGPQELDLIANLTRIMLLQAIVMGAGVIATSVLQARQNFLLPAIGSVLYNVGLIAGLVPGLYLVFHGHRTDVPVSAIYAATWGVVIGALLMVAVQIPGLFKVGMHYTLSFDWKHPGVRQIGRQMIPRVVNAAMLYLSMFVDRFLLQLLVVGTLSIGGLITQYYQSLQLVVLPIGIFGMAVSTAAFPTLAENVARGHFDRVRNTILETLRNILFMAIPSSVGLIVLALPIIQVLLEHGAFHLSEAESTAFPLAFFALGLSGLAAVEILTRSFYAMRDSRTPVLVNVWQFVFKIALSLILINVAVWGVQWGMGALAFATSLAGLLEAAGLFWLLHRRIGDLRPRATLLFTGRVLLAALAMGLALLITRNVLDFTLALIARIPFLIWLDTMRTQSLGLLGTLVALVKLSVYIFVGILVYIRVARRLGIEELGPLKRILDRLKLSWI